MKAGWASLAAAPAHLIASAPGGAGGAAQSAPSPRGGATPRLAGGVGAVRRSLLEAERSFSDDSSKRDARAAILMRAHETLRPYRQNTSPIAGRGSVGGAISRLVTLPTPPRLS